MSQPVNLDHLKQQFRQGRHAEAIAACEAAIRQEPGNRPARRLCATMHALTRNHARALDLLQELREPGRVDGELLFNIGTLQKDLQRDQDAADTFASYTAAFPADAAGWANLAECRFRLNAFEEGSRHAAHALKLDPSLVQELVAARVRRGDAMLDAGRREEAAADYQAALAMQPRDDATLKKATMCLLESNRAEEAIQLCRDVLRADPDNLTAKLGAEWLLSKIVPLWHVPMMNEEVRNGAYHAGLQAAVKPGQTVLEIGTGSGLLAMMAAKLGAAKVYTCEAVPLVAHTAQKIVARNGYQEQVTVLAKPSDALRIGEDLPARADLLVHEIFSSELLGENVLGAIEDAKARLLKPGGAVMPAAASIMIALVGGDALGRNVHVANSFGFDLGEFNAIQPRKRPLYREDLAPVLLSDAVEAFRFDFAGRASFPAEKKRIQLQATAGGACYGVLQWIRIELAPGVVFENHPSVRRDVSNWQHTAYVFDAPVQLERGASLGIDAWHDRTRPWFERAA
jgi:tetratricopeptide (TPR) repeat protein